MSVLNTSTLLGDLAACGGLVMGAVCASPLVLALPTSVIESVGFWSALKRSLFLIRGRWVKALSVIFLCISLACIGATVRFFFPSATFYIVPFEPILISWSAVGLGALYLHLYDH